MWQKHPWPQANAKPFPIGRAVAKRRGFRLWSPHRQGNLARQFGDHEFATALSNREKRVSTLAMTMPDPFDKRRVGRPVLIKDNHPFPSERAGKRGMKAFPWRKVRFLFVPNNGLPLFAPAIPFPFYHISAKITWKHLVRGSLSVCKLC